MNARVLMLALLWALGATMAAADAPSLGSLSWPERKCLLYQRAWASALAALDHPRISADFRALNQEFVQSGCTMKGSVCPRSPAEFDMANMLTVMTMSEGMASTFVPFHCPE